MSDCFFEKFNGGDQLLFALGLLFDPRERIFSHLKIGEDQLECDHFDVVDRINAARYVDDIEILKAANDLDDRVGLANVGEELIAETLSLRCAFYQACDIDEAHGGVDDLFAIRLGRKSTEAGIVDIDDAEIRIDGAKRIVF